MAATGPDAWAFVVPCNFAGVGKIGTHPKAADLWAISSKAYPKT